MRFAPAAIVLLAGLAAVGPALAQSGPIGERKQAMKAMQDQAEIGAAILKGRTPYDAAKAALIFKTFGGRMKNYGTLFPPGSNTGDTKAQPAIWSDRAGFDAAIAKFGQLVADNAPKAATADGFKAAFVAVADGCRSCHQGFKAR
ncbi:c-type cytochrome [Xanthobacter pseudotagetidis]|uniref:c-type cytochrome n=1 Tax=Xanthobacter pseudotagetidis TaxID=3119911 RepID=UPI003729FD58